MLNCNMSLDSRGLTKEEYETSLGFLREANVNISLRRFDLAIGYLNKDLKFRYSVQDRTHRRVHKGAAYYNLGVCYLFEEKYDENEAVHNFLLAYVEDCISNALSPQLAEYMDAARILRISLGIDPRFLTHIETAILAIKIPANILDPMRILLPTLQFAKEQGTISEASLASLCKFRGPIPKKIELTRFVNWEKRVFIGGNYASHIPNLLKIKEIVIRLNFEPVIVDDYVIPEDRIRQFSLMLLHTCKFAIFDITTAGGQYIEIERARDYGIKPLFIFSADSVNRDHPLTSGLKMLAAEDLKAYRDMETELEPLIKRYLLGQVKSVDS